MASVNEQILISSIRQSLMLEQYKNYEIERIIAIFNDSILPDLTAKLESRFGRGQLNWTTKRIQAMKDIINQTLNLSPMYKQNKADMVMLADEQAKQFANALNKAVAPIGLEATAPATQQLRAMVASDPFQGATLREWYSDLQANTRKEMVRQMQIGIGENETVRQMTDRIVGTASEAFTDGTAEKMRRDAATIVRTATNHVNTQARKMTFEENSDVVKGYQFVATLDSKTSEICMQYDGQVWNLGDPSAQTPPLHMNCRSTLAPVLKSWEELGINLKEAPEGTRASFSGQVPSKITYPEWLRTQSREVQDRALGKTRAEMWRNGQISIDKFTNDRNQKLTLKQLKNQGYDVPRNVGGEPLTPTGKTPASTDFVPAKSIEDAEKFAASKLINASEYRELGLSEAQIGQALRDSVNYKGVPLDVANSVNKEFYAMQTKHNLPKLSAIGTNARHADSLLEFQSTSSGASSTFEVHVNKAKIDQRIKPAGIKLGDVANENNLSGFWASKTTDDLAFHEACHYFHRSGMVPDDVLERAFSRAQGFGNIAETIGQYAEKNAAEYYAETMVNVRNLGVAGWQNKRIADLLSEYIP